MERFAIIGFGCAGYHGLAAIREAGCDAAIDIYSDTALPPYNPMLTTYYTAGRLPFEGMFPFGTMEEIAARYKADFITHTKVKAVHAKEKTVETWDGHKEPYDRILVATGASAFVPGSFAGLKGAFCMRTVEDAVRLHDALEAGDYKDAVVVGASMVGIKVAELLHKKGIHVTLADMASHIFALAAYPQVSEIIETQADEAGLRYVVRIGRIHTPYFYGDALRISQILINILGNAVKFTPTGGTIGFSVEELSSAKGKHQACYRFTVSDTGIGMSGETQAQLFEPFIRSNAVSRVEGSGLGLSIVKGLVDLMNGTISVQSELGKGSVFTVELESEAAPAPEDEGIETEKLEEPAGRPFAGCRFLAAEDNELNAEILCEILRMYGARSEVKGNGIQVVDAFFAAAPGTYDAILMDIQMVWSQVGNHRYIRAFPHGN